MIHVHLVKRNGVVQGNIVSMNIVASPDVTGSWTHVEEGECDIADIESSVPTETRQKIEVLTNLLGQPWPWTIYHLRRGGRQTPRVQTLHKPLTACAPIAPRFAWVSTALNVAAAW